MDMRLIKVAVLVFALLFGARLASSAAATKDSQVLPTPVLRAVSPDTIKAGEMATVSGEYLDKSRVADLFLTVGGKDVKVEILEQSASSIKFKVPNNIATGRYTLSVLLADVEPKLIEAPARLTIE